MCVFDDFRYRLPDLWGKVSDKENHSFHAGVAIDWERGELGIHTGRRFVPVEEVGHRHAEEISDRLELLDARVVLFADAQVAQVGVRGLGDAARIDPRDDLAIGLLVPVGGADRLEEAGELLRQRGMLDCRICHRQNCFSSYHPSSCAFHCRHSGHINHL